MTTTPSPAWAALFRHAESIKGQHLREVLADSKRCTAMSLEHTDPLGTIYLDWSRQNAVPQTLKHLLDLAREVDLQGQIKAMFAGEKINRTENRSVLHHALRLPKTESLLVDGVDVVPQVHEVLAKIKAFSEQVRDGKRKGITGKPLTEVVSIGIGGSYLGPDFVHEALRTEPSCSAAADGRHLRFLANVDPIDLARSLEDLDPARTLIVVVSKTFTTAETMLNARAVRSWLLKKLGKGAVAKHMVAVSTNVAEVKAFGIDPENIFPFWDWVGGRYSVTSAVGVLPLALQFGYRYVEKFLAGAHSIDKHFRDAPLDKNLPVILGMYGIWNTSVLGRPTRALLPYCQALHRFAAHIQQVDMESNGKRVGIDGKELTREAGEIDFGEPGTNGQHSFYQLLHQGRVVPADFIGFRKSQRPLHLAEEPVSNHDELMANFFAQPDALAYGKTAAEVKAEGTPAALIPHKVFPGNRPSTVILGDVCDAYAVGQLLALYEHRTAVQGFIWGLNSFDQWGVELGKSLAKAVRAQLAASRASSKAPVKGFNPATAALLKRYMTK